jgi:hypothetical protein
VERTLVIMAAGMGSRYGGLKQTEAVGPSGEWILDFSVFDAIRAGFDRIVFVVREDFVDVFRRRIDARWGDRCRIAYVCQRLDDLPERFSPILERTKPWGTGHAVLSCRGEIDGPFGVINADDFYGRDAFERLVGLLADLPMDGRRLGLVGYRLDRTLTDHGTVSRGVCEVDEAGRLVGIIERKHVRRDPDGASYLDGDVWHPIPSGAIASMNMWAFPRVFLDRLGEAFVRFLAEPESGVDAAEFLIPTVVGDLVEDGTIEVSVLRTEATWFGVTHREDLEHVRSQIAKQIEHGAYPGL